MRARERAQQERRERIEQALQRLPELEKLKETQDKKTADARASTSDAEATVMKVSDGGFRPAYNAQYATDTGTRGQSGSKRMAWPHENGRSQGIVQGAGCNR